MPRRLLDRCNLDCISEFREAARERFDDALAVAGDGRRTGAVYLWGYTVEMLLKAAYFALLGFPEARPITSRDLRDAIDRGRALGIAWARQGDWHNVRAWAELIVAARASSPATAFAPRFALDVQRHGQRIEQLWRETLRYRKNRAYEFELKQVREAAEWFLINSPNL